MDIRLATYIRCGLIGIVILGACQAPLSTPEVPTATNAPDATLITLHYHERPPYAETTATGVITGITAMPAQRAFEQAGIAFRWQQTPSKRQLEILQQNQGRDCALGWFKNPEREQFARYTVALYQDKPTVALARADNDAITSGATVADILANPALTLLVKDSYSYGAFIDQQIAAHAVATMSTTSENVGMIQMLYARRADYLFIAPEEVAYLIKVAGFSNQDFKQIEFSDMIPGNLRYIICSFQVAETVIDQLNGAIQSP